MEPSCLNEKGNGGAASSLPDNGVCNVSGMWDSEYVACVACDKNLDLVSICGHPTFIFLCSFLWCAVQIVFVK